MGNDTRLKIIRSGSNKSFPSVFWNFIFSGVEDNLDLTVAVELMSELTVAVELD